MQTATATFRPSATFRRTLALRAFRRAARAILAHYSATAAALAGLPTGAGPVTPADRLRAARFAARVGAAPAPREPFAPVGWDEGDAGE